MNWGEVHVEIVLRNSCAEPKGEKNEKGVWKMINHRSRVSRVDSSLFELWLIDDKLQSDMKGRKPLNKKATRTNINDWQELTYADDCGKEAFILAEDH